MLDTLSLKIYLFGGSLFRLGPLWGVIAQINNVAIALNIAVSENVGVAMKNYEFLHTQLESHARGRSTNIDYFALLSEEQPEIKRRSLKDATHSEGSSSGYHNNGKNFSRSSNDFR